MSDAKISEREHAVLKVVEAYAGSGAQKSPESVVKLYKQLLTAVQEHQEESKSE